MLTAVSNLALRSVEELAGDPVVRLSIEGLSMLGALVLRINDQER